MLGVSCETSVVGCVLPESSLSEATVLLSVLLHSSVPAFLSPAFSPVPVGRGESLITSVSHSVWRSSYNHLETGPPRPGL